MRSRLSTSRVIRLEGRSRDWLEGLSACGPLYLQARNSGGGLGKTIPHFHFLVEEEHGVAFDLEQGLEIALGELMTWHGGCIDTDGIPAPAMDMEFRGFPAGISLHAFPWMETGSSLEHLICSFGGSTHSHESLHAWRSAMEELPQLCPCCIKRAENRARTVESHPLHHIFQHAGGTGTALDCRLLSRHVNFTTRLVPHLVTARDGYLVVTNPEQDSALHIDMRMVHALAIDVEHIDATAYASLRIFDMHGQGNFQFLSEDPQDASLWRGLCEAVAAREATKRED